MTDFQTILRLIGSDPVAAMRQHLPDYVDGCENRVPEHLRAGLLRYVLLGIVPGDFLQAVIRNDLRGCIRFGDDASLDGLPGIVRFLWNRCPTGCWGSSEHMREWAHIGGLLRAKESA